MSSKIKRIYTGLPQHLSKAVVWVERKYRVNELSHQPGGFDVVLEYQSGNVLGYDWIKRPSFYIQRILQNDLASEEATDFEELDDARQLTIAKGIIRAAYARNYHDKALYDTAEFQQVWDATTARITLKKALQAFESQSHSPEETTNLTFVERVLKYQKASNIRHLSFFLPGCGIENHDYDNSFEIDLACKEEGDEWFPGAILMQFPATILSDMLPGGSAINALVTDISFVVTEEIQSSNMWRDLELRTPSTIYRRAADGTMKAVKNNKPARFRCVINEHGISIMHDNGWCATIGGDTRKWIFS